MIAAISARLLIATLGLLACATSASAECAWVLWQSSVIAGEEQWSVVSAYSPSGGDEDACKQAAARFNRRGEQKSDIPGRLYVHVCLPDTVDPRGPKGK